MSRLSCSVLVFPLLRNQIISFKALQLCHLVLTWKQWLHAIFHWMVLMFRKTLRILLTTAVVSYPVSIERIGTFYVWYFSNLEIYNKCNNLKLHFWLEIKTCLNVKNKKVWHILASVLGTLSRGQNILDFLNVFNI